MSAVSELAQYLHEKFDFATLYLENSLLILPKRSLADIVRLTAETCYVFK